MADNVPSQTQDYTNLIIKTQQDCIDSLKLNLRLMDDKFIMLNQQLQQTNQVAETWKSRYNALETQYSTLKAQEPTII